LIAISREWFDFHCIGGNPDHFQIFGGNPDPFQIFGGNPDHFQIFGGSSVHFQISGWKSDQQRTSWSAVYSLGDFETLIGLKTVMCPLKKRRSVNCNWKNEIQI